MTSTDDYQNIKELLKKHDYEVCVSSEKSNTNDIIVSFPLRKERPFCNQFEIKYTFNLHGSEGVFTRVNKEHDRFFNCPKYAFSELISANIDSICYYINYNKDLIYFSVEGLPVSRSVFWEKSFLNMLNKEEKKKAELLSFLISDALQVGFRDEHDLMAVSDNVQDGYKAIKSIYETEESF